uniref:Uncharacterized protein n=1 Tax=Megaselia scalaris TaxID=36166 RepID=T1GW13_MEGSC
MVVQDRRNLRLPADLRFGSSSQSYDENDFVAAKRQQLNEVLEFVEDKIQMKRFYGQDMSWGLSIISAAAEYYYFTIIFL